MASILKTDQIKELTPNNGIIAGNTIKVPDGSAANPSLTFNNDPDSGLYRISDNKVGITAGGVKVGEFGQGYGGFVGGAIQTVFSSGTTTVGPIADTYLLNTQFTPKSNNSLIVIFGNICTFSQSGGNDSRSHMLFQVSPISTELARIQFFFGQTGASTTRGGGTIMAIISNTSLSMRTFALRISHDSSGTVQTIGSYTLLIQEIAQ
jgi:hypothetical protein